MSAAAIAATAERKSGRALSDPFLFGRESAEPRLLAMLAGGRHKLTGNVTTWNARRLAGMPAWSAPGATSVDNAINVSN